MSNTIDIRTYATQQPIDTIRFSDKGWPFASQIKKYDQTFELENVNGDSKSSVDAADIPNFIAAINKGVELGWFK